MEELKDLTVKQKQVLMMKYFKGMRVGDIAELIGISHQTVSEHLQKALHTLQVKARHQGISNL